VKTTARNNAALWPFDAGPQDFLPVSGTFQKKVKKGYYFRGKPFLCEKNELLIPD
jgi:hypothetical protein